MYDVSRGKSYPKFSSPLKSLAGAIWHFCQRIDLGLGVKELFRAFLDCRRLVGARKCTPLAGALDY